MILARLVEWTWNGDSSNGPGIFSWFHILWLLIAIAGAVGLVFLAKKKDKIKRLDDWVILSMAVVLIISEIPKHILYDIEYYGWDSFDKTANGEHMDIVTARNFEYYLVRRYDLTNPEKGYNQNYGGFSARGRKATDQERKAMQSRFESKPVRCVETGVVYSGIREAARAIGLGHQNISAACHGKTKTSGGFHWELVEEKAKNDSGENEE